MDRHIRSMVDNNKMTTVLVIIGLSIALGIAPKNMAVGLGYNDAFE